MKNLSRAIFALLFLCLSLMSDSDVYGSKNYTKLMNEHLISAEDAMKLLSSDNVVFVSGDDHNTYEAIGHINAKHNVEMYAHHLHHADITGHMHCAPLFMCPDEAEEFISSKGITNDTLVIAYDNFRGPNATGVWAFFKSWGHINVKILNGGMDAIKAIDPNQIKYNKYKKEYKKWRKKSKKAKKSGDKTKAKEYMKKANSFKKIYKSLSNNLVIQKGKEKKYKKSNYKIETSKINHDLIVSKYDVKKASDDIMKNGKNSNYVIIDTRGMTEIIGERKMDNVARGGHVPGAKFIEWKNITDFDNKLSFVDLGKIQKVFDRYGVSKDKTIYAYCHVGAGRSTHIVTALRMLGYKNAKVYTGSWDEWGNDMNLPVLK
jgi:thiosulfate/3-mercaptopyruvate sulfurtransferase